MLCFLNFIIHLFFGGGGGEGGVTPHFRGGPLPHVLGSLGLRSPISSRGYTLLLRAFQPTNFRESQIGSVETEKSSCPEIWARFHAKVLGESFGGRQTGVRKGKAELFAEGS